MDPSEIKEKIVRFRILIIGRANAGKTTILKRVCNTQDNPEIFDSAGKKIDIAVLTASRERGEHNIENEMVFRSNPGFIFHDSRGFEAGGESEYDKVNAFIKARSKERDIKDRIHTIWYCIPMDEESRCFTEGELKFFSHCDTGSIPVIVLFTKFDALYDIEFARLTENGASRKDAKKLAPKHAEETFANGPQLKFLYHSKDIRRPPKCHVCLPEMDNDNADCGLLIERTAGTLDNEVLQQLFVSTQQTNLEVCMKCAVQKTLARLVASAVTISSQDAIQMLGASFPHLWARHLPRRTDRLTRRTYTNDADRAAYWRLAVDADYWLADRSHYDRDYWADEAIYKRDCLDPAHREETVSRLLSVASGSSPLETIVQLSSGECSGDIAMNLLIIDHLAAVIIFEHSFYIFDKRRYLQEQQNSGPSYIEALEKYMASPYAAAVREAVSTAVHTYQGNSSAWKARLPFQTSQKKAKRHEMIKTILEITLQYRLPRP